ncbi:MAG: MATE family efflux transporter [Spirochaetes bacterium]|nr:MAG: MATE family efflux transporter [Spirochaetota bacterium]
MSEFKKKEIKGIYEGPVFSILIKLTLPILAGMLFQLVYNVIDTLWISRIDSSDPSYVGGTGIIFPVVFIAISLSNGILVGISSLVARGIGEENKKIVNLTTESGLFIAVILAVIVIVFGYIFDDKLVSILGAEGSYSMHALEYLRYIIPGAAAMFTLSVFNGILQGEGLMKYVMISMAIGTIVNIILDPLFIFILSMGVKGAALATVIAQVFSVVYSVSVFIRNKTLIKVEWKIGNIHPHFISKIIAIGFPQSLAMIFIGISFLIFNRIVISIDPLALTAFSLCGRFDQIVLIPLFALGAALITLVGQNAGRGNYERIKQIMLSALVSSFVVIIVTATSMVIAAPWIYSFFSTNKQVVLYAVTQTRLMEYFYLFAAVGIISRSFFQAIGSPFPAFVIVLMRLLLIAVPSAYIFVYIFNMGMYGVWLGLITGNFITAVVSSLWTSARIKSLLSREVY